MGRLEFTDDNRALHSRRHQKVYFCIKVCLVSRANNLND